MAENQERYYKGNTLNVIFAVASIILLVTIIVMFVDDYSREWKGYQRDFRRLEIAKSRSLYDEELANLKNKTEYEDLLKKLEVAKKEISARSSKRPEADWELQKLKAHLDISQQKYQFQKAQFDASRYQYEDALAHNDPSLNKKKEHFEQVKKDLEQLLVDREAAQTAFAKKQTEIQQESATLKDLEKERSEFAKQANILERKLKRIDPKSMSFANKVAQGIRNLPILDMLNPSYRVEQIVLPDITDDVNFMRVPKADRCMTCHLGALTPGFEDAPQPFRTHPNLELFLSSNSAHPVEEFGCTSCHNGRGRGTSFESAAHMPSSEAQKKEWERKYNWKPFEYWEAPIYPKKFTQAGCFKCHSGETSIKGAEKLNLGLNLIEKSGCFGCHLIEKYKTWPKVGPDLTHLASKVSKGWASRWISDPKSFRHNTWMPAFFFQSNTDDEASKARNEQEIHAVVQYLFQNSQEFKLTEVKPGDAKKGKELVSSLGCFGCHDVQPEKIPDYKRTTDTLRREHGPNLVGMGTKTNPEWIFNWLKDPNRYHPKTRMPNLRLTDEEAQNITAYLASGENPEFMKKPIPQVNEEILNTIANDFLTNTTTVADAKAQLAKMSTDEKLLFAGKNLIRHHGCYACHIIPGFENEKPIGTELTEEGSKSPHKLDFGFVHLSEHTNYAWFMQKLKDPRIFDKDRVRTPLEKLKMPNFHFTDDEAEAITTAILGFVKDKPSPSKIKPRTPENLFMENGQRLVREFNCQGCHIMEGQGGSIRPMVTDWLVKYEGRDQADAEAVTPSFSPPNLVGEGEKVQTDWLFGFIHNPTVIRPWLKIRMPIFGFPAEEINSLAKYFSALDKEEFPFVDKPTAHLTVEEYHAAQKLFSKNYFDCIKCHIVGDKMPEGSADSWAPDFLLAKTRLKPDWIIKWLRDPQQQLPGTKMPTFFDPNSFDTSGPDDVLNGDEKEQIRVLHDFLLTLTPDDLKNLEENKPAEPTATAK